MKNFNKENENINEVKENEPAYTGFAHKSEDEKLRENIERSPIEKLRLFTKMLKREALFKKAKISHI